MRRWSSDVAAWSARVAARVAQAAAAQQRLQRFAAPERVEAQLPRRRRRLRDEHLRRLALGLGKLGGKAKRAGEKPARRGNTERSEADPASIHLSPNERRDLHVAEILRALLGAAWRAADAALRLRARRHRADHARGTIARERNDRRALGRGDRRCASLRRRRRGPAESARSKPVAMTVTRISPCIAGSCTAPKMISASSPTASWMISLI